MKAQEFFEECRTSLFELEKSEHLFSELTDTGLKAVNYDSVHGGSGDPMARIDAGVDMIKDIAEKRREIHRLFDIATYVLYGDDSRKGLDKLNGVIYADILCCYYLQGMSWVEISKRSESFSNKQARNYAMSGLRFIDKHGLLPSEVRSR